LNFTHAVGGFGKSPSRNIYSQYRQLVFGTETQDFKIRKMNKDRSNDPRIYSSVYDHIQEQHYKQLERDQKKLQKYINGKPVDFKPKHKK